MNKIFKWLSKLIPKNLLPSSGNPVSFGMTNYERYQSAKGTTVLTSNIDETLGSVQQQSVEFGNNANLDPDGGGPGTSGATRVAMLVAPYGMGEFYAWKYASCLLVGTKILMFDGTEKNIEDVEVNEAIYSPALPDLKAVYNDYTLDSLDDVKLDKALIKMVVFDFTNNYWIVNGTLKCTGANAVLAWKDKGKRFEWWQVKDLDIGDKLVNSKLELEEVKTLEQIDEEVELVTIGLKSYNVFFADGYMNHD